jgi:hypothetical protein
MCHTYVDSVGYVCFECQTEFKEYLALKGIVTKTEQDIRRALEEFMETYKDSYTAGKEMTVEDFFNNYTR